LKVEKEVLRATTQSYLSQNLRRASRVRKQGKLALSRKTFQMGRSPSVTSPKKRLDGGVVECDLALALTSFDVRAARGCLVNTAFRTPPTMGAEERTNRSNQAALGAPEPRRERGTRWSGF
jgi:hypothetical protein